MQAQITHILPLTNIQRSRLLPSRGRVLVKVDQKVNATDIIAEANLNHHHILVDVRSALGLNNPKKCEKAIVRKIGDRLQEGDVIAENNGVFHKVLRSPVDGQIVTIQGGQVLLEVKHAPFGLLAGYTGVVTEIVQERGAIIENSGTLIQGIWANERINQGMLIVLARKPDDELKVDMLDVSMRGSILMSGYCSDAKVLQTAGELSLRGLIFGSMASDLVPIAEKMNYPVILIDGFGKTPVNSIAFNILTTNEKRDVSLFGGQNDFFSGQRPEIFIPLPTTGETPPETDEFKEGQAVRVRVPPYTGKIGVLVQTHPGLTILENGLRVPAADVRLETEELVKVPLMNLDVLE